MEFSIRGKKISSPIHLIDMQESNVVDEIISYEMDVTRSQANQFHTDPKKHDSSEIVFDDGTTWIGSADDLQDLFNLEATRGDTGKDVLVIPEAVSIETNRGIVDTLKIKLISFFKYKAVEWGAKEIAQKIDKAKVKRQGLFKVNSNFSLENISDVDIDTEKPALLFIHGTCSNFEGGFKGIPSDEDNLWIELQKEYQNRIFAFQHHTLSVSPLENAILLINQLPNNISLHIISHSRGGIIGDILCKCDVDNSGFSKNEIKLLQNNDATKEQIAFVKELNILKQKKQFRVENFIRVACPASGTRLLSRRIDHFFNILNNVLRLSGAGSLLSSEIGDLVLHLIKQKENPAVLPGLASMVPDSVFQKLLNNTSANIISSLSIVYSNAGQRRKLSKGIAFILRQLIFRRDNDFVVDLSSMFFGANRVNAIRGLEIKNPPVAHSSYFANKQLRTSLLPELRKQYIQSEFDVKSASDADRSIKLIPHGKYMADHPAGNRPIVVVLPGIMGSVLSKEDNVKWLDYGDLFEQGINELELDSKQQSTIEASHLIATSYSELCEFLIKNGFDVLSFPYDWRKSIQTEGERLATELTTLMDKVDQPIKIIAHSMGGLLMKDVIGNHESVYNRLSRLSGFRFIMLGTPWKGSFLIAQFLMGQGKRFKALDKLSILQDKSEILNTTKTFPGVVDLLPLERDNNESEFDLTDINDWTALKQGSGEVFWSVPDKKLLQKFITYQNGLNLDKLNPKHIKYVAGKAKWTVNGLSIKEDENDFHKWFKASKIRFKSTQAGDGSVTWKYGIPEDFQEKDMLGGASYSDNVYFVDSNHGSLSSNKSLFQGYLDLLQSGETSKSEFLKEPPMLSVRGNIEMDDVHILPNKTEDLWDVILGSDAENHFDQEEEFRTIKITFSAGHLKKSSYPILVGHQTSSSIKGSELAVNDLLENKLSQLLTLGLYPNDKETSEVILTYNKIGFKGAIIVGTGDKENQTGYILERSVEKAAIKYMLTISEHNHSRDQLLENGTLGLSTVFISSYYGGLSLNVSMDSIINGVAMANQAMKSIGSDIWISEIEFVEIYEDRCQKALLGLRDMAIRKLIDVPIEINNNIRNKDGAKLSLPIDHNSDWYTRYAVSFNDTKNAIIKGLEFRSSAGLAREEVIPGYMQKDMMDFLIDIIPDSNLNMELSKTLFELLIPNDFKSNFKRQGNILLVLDKETANYPWEMMAPDLDTQEPLAVRAAMVRQFSTGTYRRELNFITDKRAFIIGNPITSNDHPDLPFAREETDIVYKLLTEAEYDKDDIYYPDSDTPPFDYLLKLMAHDYKIIHIAAHGVYNEEDEFAKIIIGPNKGDILTPVIFDKMRNTPEIAFINCCYIGEIDKDKEELARKRYKIASSIGAQLLEQGFKAVIVAGWAINDRAALTFAESFYTEILAGTTFGQAVKTARRLCYQKNRNSNTWGAYQCYGDPEYRLVDKSHINGFDDSIVIDQQAKIFLRDFSNDAKHKKTRNELSIDRLHDIAYKIENSSFSNNAEILELLAFAYAEVLEWEAAIKQFENLFKIEKAGYTFTAYEKYHNIKIRHAYKTIKKLRNNGQTGIREANAIIKSSIKELAYLCKKEKTSERLSLIGSAYQRQYALNTKEKDIQEMIAAYCAAFKKCDFKNISSYHYSLILLLKAWYFQNNDSCKDVLDIIQLVADSHSKLILMLEKELTTNKKSTTFWDEIAPVSLLQYQLLISQSEEEMERILKRMKTIFTKAWEIGGAFQHLSTEIEHMDFLLVGIKNLSQNGSLTISKESKLTEYKEHLKSYFVE